MLDTMKTQDVDESESSFGLKSKSQDVLRNSEIDGDWGQEEAKALSRQPPSTRILSWLDWFCELEEHQFVTKIDPDFVRDPTNSEDFCKNATHLGFGPVTKSRLSELIALILSPQCPNSQELQNSQFQQLN